jgi:hypothetical protein
MRYHVLLPDPDRPYPRYFSQLDDEARRLVAETSPGEDLLLVRQDGDRLVRLPDLE